MSSITNDCLTQSRTGCTHMATGLIHGVNSILHMHNVRQNSSLGALSWRRYAPWWVTSILVVILGGGVSILGCVALITLMMHIDWASLQLPEHSAHRSDCNFIIRMLYRNIL